MRFAINADVATTRLELNAGGYSYEYAINEFKSLAFFVRGLCECLYHDYVGKNNKY